MDPSHLAPSPIDGPNKALQIQDAKDMYQVVLRNAERSNSAVPPYEFVELIGKGASGRVYKCKKNATGELVAVKIVNIDAEDYSSDTLDKDDTLESFRKEVGILQQLKDSKARNVNLIHEAFDLHNQLWIVSDYCTGGSVRTLMRATPPPNKGLEESYIIPIARELAKAIKSVHDIGVIHRDVKCTNVYISEVGEIQLGDFGIVGVIDGGDGSSKRKTIIGTPHFMPREMLYATNSHLTAEGYGTEVDIWAYGCTLYEMATGSPPNAHVYPQNLPVALETAPRLDKALHSPQLCDFVAFCLESDPAQRPSIDAILTHSYIGDSETRHPTRCLVQLIDRYAVWELRGGQRQSLFMRGGAAAPSTEHDPMPFEDDEHDWNFSTSDNFNQAFSKRMSHMVATRDFAASDWGDPGRNLVPIITKDLTPLEQFEQYHRDASANRGERSLDRLWNPDSSPYELHTPVDDVSPPSDLPLRNFGAAQPRESLIDLDTAGGHDLDTKTRFNFDFEDIPTMKAKAPKDARHSYAIAEEDDEYEYATRDIDDKRATMDWKFPGSTLSAPEPDLQTVKRATMDWTFEDAAMQGTKRATMDWTFPSGDNAPTSALSDGDLPPGFRPTLKHAVTEPLTSFHDFNDDISLSSGPPTAQLIRDSMHSMIDLDLSNPGSPDPPRPRTASSTAASIISVDPFDLEEEPVQDDVDVKRISHHKPWQSEGGRLSRNSGANLLFRSRANSLNSTDSERGSLLHPRDSSLGGTRRVGEPWADIESSSGVDDEEEEAYPTVRVPRSARRFRPEGRSGTGSIPEPPHPSVLREGAPEELLRAEMERLLDELDLAFDEASRAFVERFAGDEDETSGAESGTTGDEDD